MHAHDCPVIAEVDVAVLGGGLAGVSAALACAAAGRPVLLVESRPLLGWEATSAFALDWPDAEADASPLPAAMLAAGGVGGDRLDGPVCEMVLERLVAQSGAGLLLYSTPVALWRDGDRLGGVVIGNKSGRQIVRARVFVDATEEGILWRLARQGATGQGARSGDRAGTWEDGVPHGSPDRGAAGVAHGRLAVFYNHVSTDPERLLLPDVPGVSGLRARPSVWPGEAAIEFATEVAADVTDASNALLLSLRRAIPAVAQALRDVPGFEDALLTHTAREAFLLSGPSLGAGPQHPELVNLLGAGPWLSGVADREAAGLLPARWRRGEEVGALAARLAAEAPLPGLPASGPAPEPAPAPACDVLVAGGGTSGALAAIAAGRQGARTRLLEGSTFLGGIGAGGGIHLYYHGITGGIQDEVDARTHELAELFGARRRLTGFHPDAKQIALQELCEAAGVELLFRTTLVGARAAGPRLEAVEAAGPAGCAVHRARAFVDSTGDADLAAMAGAQFALGRERDELAHTFSQACQQLDANGAIGFHNFDAGYVDATDVTDLTRARRLGLQHLWRQDGFTAETRLLTIAPLLGLRQSRQILGDTVVTLDDQVRGRRFADAIAYARAHYDNHAFDYENESDDAALWVWLLGAWQDRIACEVPYRCLLPQGIEGLLVACRAISLTHDAHMMFRMQRDMQLIGEAAGTAAALAALAGVPPREVDLPSLQAALLHSGVLRRKPIAEEHGGTPEEWIAELDAAQPKEAVWCLAHAGPEAQPALLAALESGSPRVRFWSAVALAMHGRPEAAPELLRCLLERADVKPEGVRTVPFWQGVIVLLGRIGDQRAVPEIIRLLEEPGGALDALLAAVRALGRIGDPEAVPALQALLEREGLATQRVFQVSSGGRDTVSDDARWQLDLATAEALAQLGAPDAAIAERYQQDPRAYVRRYAERVRRMSLLRVRV